MNTITNQSEQKESKESLTYRAKTFEVSGNQVKNSYLCNQARFTVTDSWRTLKQKRQFLVKG